MIKVYWYIEDPTVFAIYYKSLNILVLTTNIDGQKSGMIFIS
jgi:hypothetical protein